MIGKVLKLCQKLFRRLSKSFLKAFESSKKDPEVHLKSFNCLEIYSNCLAAKIKHTAEWINITPPRSSPSQIENLQNPLNFHHIPAYFSLHSPRVAAYCSASISSLNLSNIHPQAPRNQIDLSMIFYGNKFPDRPSS